MKRWYKVTIYNQSLEAIADLKNAFDISYDMRMNDLSTAGFSLPAEDPQNAYCEGLNYIEIFDGDRRIELFTIVETEKVQRGRKMAIRYECVHVLWTLAWDLLFGIYEDRWVLKKDLNDIAGQLNVMSLTYDVAHEVIIAGTLPGGQIWTSSDGGETWVYKAHFYAPPGLAQIRVPALAYDSVNEVVVAGTAAHGQLWVSADGGENWTIKKDLSLEVPAQLEVFSLVYDKAHEVLVAGTYPDGQIWTSPDGGENWTLKKTLSAEVPAQSLVRSLIYDSVNEVIVAGTYPDGQIWTSPDGGENWTLKKTLSSEDPAQTYVNCLAYDVAHEMLIAGTIPNAQIWTSLDSGETWTLKKDLSSETPAQENVASLVYDAAHELVIAGTTQNAQLWESIDGGGNWALQKDLSEETPAQAHVTALTFDSVNRRIIAGTGLYAQIWMNAVNIADMLRLIIYQQTVARWQLGTCDFTDEYLYKFENINLMSAMLAVPKPIDAEWQFTFDTTSYPWTLNLVEASTDVAAHVVYRRNLKAVGWRQNFRNLVTRLYALGFGEGVNQLTVENENPTGEKYIDAATSYPQISGVMIAREIEDEEVLYNEAVAKLSDLSVAPQRFSVDTIDLARLNKRDYLDPGDYVRIEHEDMDIETSARVVRVGKRNVEKSPGKIDIEISEKARTVGGTVAGIATSVGVEQTQSQGATNVLQTNFADNADPDHPAELRFRIWADVVYVNRVLLTYRTEPYRMFTRPTESGTCTTSSDAPAAPHSHTVPDHSHDIIGAITEDSDEPSAVIVTVDGNTVEGFSPDETDRDISQYLDGYDEGQIYRGWHTIEITPNDGAKVARIVASVFVQTYVQSRGGDKL